MQEICHNHNQSSVWDGSFSSGQLSDEGYRMYEYVVAWILGRQDLPFIKFLNLLSLFYPKSSFCADTSS